MKLLLLLPFAGLAIVPFYNRIGPELWGIPFFYWYQLAWVPVTSVLLWIVDRATRGENDDVAQGVAGEDRQ